MSKPGLLFDTNQLIDASAFLSRLYQQSQYPEITDAELPQHLQSLTEQVKQIAPTDNSDEFIARLQQRKAEFSFYWALLELKNLATFSWRGECLSNFAAATINSSLQQAWHEIASKNKTVRAVLDKQTSEVGGLFILGLGKLGGKDLNFSSDVDLVAFFDPQSLAIPDSLGKSYICHQVLQSLTRLLGAEQTNTFVWRVDWRLRPNASATTLAMSVSAALDYYYYRASPWHRLALMKARVVAGDRVAGEQFIDAITPFIWRQNLDYRALDELGEIKARINLEHPALKTERKRAEAIDDDVSGYSVKLGTGGIREIEFIVNALQLVWGGKYYPLRQPNTLQAINDLLDLQLIDKAQADELAAAYQFQRGLENAIQILDNQQTHTIPTDDHQLGCLQQLLSIADWQDYIARLNQHRHHVQHYFRQIFIERDNQAHIDIHWPDQLSEAAKEIVHYWESGFVNYGVNKDTAHRLRPLTQALSAYMLDIKQVNETILRVHEFFKTLPQGEQYFRLLAESPALLNSIIPPLLHSPPMSRLLKQSPHIIDCFMVQQDPDQFDSQFVVQAQRYEIRLERLRRFVNEQLYQLYLQFLNGEMLPGVLQHNLYRLAVHSLERALQLVQEEMQLEQVPISVLGMGKMGSGKMAPDSDLDLVFIFDQHSTSLELASRFVSRLHTAISTPMREGVVYELDTRLRPSGKSGAPTVSMESFAAHQLNRAHTWEHIALVPGSMITDDAQLGERVAEIKQKVLFQPRNQQQFITDATSMWNRICEHRIKPVAADIMFSKLRPGGLMQAEYLAACLVLMGLPETDDIRFSSLVSIAAKQHDFALLEEAIDFWQIQQLFERLLGFQNQSVRDMPAQYQSLLLTYSKVQTVDELIDKNDYISNAIIQFMNQLLANVE